MNLARVLISLKVSDIICLLTFPFDNCIPALTLTILASPIVAHYITLRRALGTLPSSRYTSYTTEGFPLA